VLCGGVCCAAAERLRREIEAKRNGIAERAAELEAMASSLSSRRAAAEAAELAAKAELDQTTVDILTLQEQLRDLEARRDEASRAWSAAQRDVKEGELLPKPQAVLDGFAAGCLCCASRAPTASWCCRLSSSNLYHQ
jgi:peptidoglycan hydrolase CwlO-like protein